MMNARSGTGAPDIDLDRFSLRSFLASLGPEEFEVRKGQPMHHRVPEPPKYAGTRFESILAALGNGPKYFVQMMAATGSRDGREIVREIEQLRAAGRIERDDEGRYVLKTV